ncbi:MAG: carbohydrate ABC transporter permease [Lachnospiraceae bacterium]|nr:carbohydrate ABC transporter permease [Lachnospiraceae bacterium]
MNSLSRVKRFKMKWCSINGVGKIGYRMVRTVILIGLCFTILYPFLVKAINSFKSFEDYLDPSVQYIPKYFTLDNIKTVLQQMRYKQSFFITLGYSTLIGIIQVGISALVGYGFARFKFWGNKLIFMLVIFELLVPPQTLMIPLFTRFRFFYGGNNLIGTLWPVIILSLTGLGIKNGLYIFMFRQFFINMPKELEEAAYIDGCNTFRTFYKVMLPSAVSLMVTVFLISFAWQWTDTTYTGLFMRGTNMLADTIKYVDGGEEEVLAIAYNNTAAVLSVLPIALVYIIGQKFFIQSVERSGITG